MNSLAVLEHWWDQLGAEVGRRLDARAVVMVLVALISMSALLWVAAWNGYPLMYFDTFGYLVDAFHSPVRPEKSLVYAHLLRASGVAGSLWPVVVFQAAATHYLLWRLWCSLGLGSRPGKYLPLVVFLALATPLSWVVSYVMPDIFTALLIVGAYLLIFAPDSLSRVHCRLVGALFLLSVAVHNSNFILSFALLGAAAVAGLVWGTVHLRRLLFPAALTAAAMVLMLTVNFARTGELVLTRGGSTYVVNRLLEDGIAQRLLEEHCKDKQYALCPYQPLPTTRLFFLFSPDSPLPKLGGWIGANSQMTPIILDALRYYPKENLIAALKQFGKQLREFEMAEYVFSFPEWSEYGRGLRAVLPRDFDAYRRARQQHGNIASPSVGLFHALVVWTCTFFSVLWSWRAQSEYRERIQALIALVWVGLIANAAICATLSHCEFRYQGRVIWLSPLCAMLAWYQRKRGRPDEGRFAPTPR